MIGTHSLSIFVVKAQDLKRAVPLKRSVQIPQLPVHPRNHCIVSQALAERWSAAQLPQRRCIQDNAVDSHHYDKRKCYLMSHAS